MAQIDLSDWDDPIWRYLTCRHLFEHVWPARARKVLAEADSLEAAVQTLSEILRQHFDNIDDGFDDIPQWAMSMVEKGLEQVNWRLVAAKLISESEENK